MILFTNYIVASRNNKRMITTPHGMTYVDKLRSWDSMAAMERERQVIHDDEAKASKDQTVREWRFRLRNNAMRRRGIYMSRGLYA